MAQYIGKTISLISVTENRYVGLLEGIDSERGVVTLNQVRCFGTEGRKNWGPQEVYPNPTVYDTVTFNGNDVKDLNILDVKLEDVQPVLPPQVMMQPQQQVPPAMADYGVYAPSTEEKAEEPAPPVRKQEPKNDEGVRRPSRKTEIPNEDFDFESNNAKFNKPAEDEEEQEEEQNTEDDSSEEVFYDKKSSFFDTISTSTETNTNMRWQEERQLNMDTFGQVSARPRRGRGGGFRGGRGRGNGRGGRGGRGGSRRGNNFRNNFGNDEKIEF